MGERSPYLCNISIQCQGIADPHDKNCDDDPAIRKQAQHRPGAEAGEDGLEDVGYAVAHDDAKGHHAAKGKGPLGDGDGNEARAAKAVLDGALEAVGAAQLAVDDNEADGPVDDDGQADEEDNAREQAGVAEGVGLADDARANDAVGHVHKGRAHARLGARLLGRVPRVHVVVVAAPAVGHRDRGRLNIRQQGQPGRVAPVVRAEVAVSAVVEGVVLAELNVIVAAAAGSILLAASVPAVSIGWRWYIGRRQIKSYSIRRPGGPRCAVAIAFRKRRVRFARGGMLDEQVIVVIIRVKGEEALLLFVLWY